MNPGQLIAFRKRLKRTQAEFAELVGVAPNTVARWERGELGMRRSTERLLQLLIKQTDLTDPAPKPAKRSK